MLWFENLMLFYYWCNPTVHPLGEGNKERLTYVIPDLVKDPISYSKGIAFIGRPGDK